MHVLVVSPWSIFVSRSCLARTLVPLVQGAYNMDTFTSADVREKLKKDRTT